jgi:hypothetical protein
MKIQRTLVGELYKLSLKFINSLQVLRYELRLMYANLAS